MKATSTESVRVMEDNQHNQALSDIILAPSEIWFLKYFNKRRHGVTANNLSTLIRFLPKRLTPIETLIELDLVEVKHLPIGGIYYDHSHPDAPPPEIMLMRTKKGLRWMELHRAHEKKYWIPIAISLVMSSASLAISIILHLLDE